MKNSLNLIFLFFLMMTSICLFGQNKNALEYSIKIIPHITSYYNTDTTTLTFLSNRTKIESLIPSPFIMLSGFVEEENYDGQFFFRTLKKRETIGGKERWTLTSSWIPIPKMTEGKTPNRTVYFGGEINADTEYIQIKSSDSTTTNFNLRLFFPGHSDENTSTHSRGESACDCEQPDICGRLCWCPSGDCPIDTTPEPTIASHFIVHHSAGQTTSSDFAAVVRSYYDFHTGTNGWDDIGYNWLIDGDGVIYEGRGQGLQGAHFSCMNQKTIGICVIGNYENATPTSEAVNALQNFIAWGACEEGIDVLAADYHPNSTLNLDNISGHRDGNDSPNACSTTVCPGENLYSLLPTIRDEIAAFPCLDENSNSINELLENEKIDVFPNPNNGKFQIRLENVELSDIVIYNSIGQKVKQVVFQNETIEIETVGLYHLQFRLDDGRIISEKVVVY